MPTEMTDASRRPVPVPVVEDCDDDFDTVVEATGRAHVLNRLVRAADADADADTAQGLLAPALPAG